MLKGALNHFLPGTFRQKLLYLRVHGRWPNLRNPRTFTEKVFWRKFYDRNPLYSICSDKLKVRAYIADRVGSEVLVPLRFETAAPDDLRSLPSWRNSVIKANHGWKMMEIVGEDEPSERDKGRIIRECRRWLKTSHSSLNGERHYEQIDPRILVEQFVGEGQKAPLDCKVHCFRQAADGSVVTVLQLVFDRQTSKSISYFVGGIDDRDVVRDVGAHPPRLSGRHRELVSYAVDKSKILSADFDYVRVDWMLTAAGMYFSELTFTPGAGLSSSMGRDLDKVLGELWVDQAARGRGR